jgi:hypothetical protein
VVLPGTETCNNQDDNCNGSVDEGNPGGGAACDGADTDLCLEGTQVCMGGTLVCNDVTGNNVETCNGVDDDCEGGIDENFDIDGDGAFDGTDAGCAATYGASVDCDDDAPTTAPGAAEACNTIDDDCDTLVDEDFDVDGDGYFTETVAGCLANYAPFTDCDDGDPAFYPGAPELCDGEDGDCNNLIPAVELDNDADGYVECEPVPLHVGNPVGGLDCDDANDTVYPAAIELCDGDDQDCDGSVDEDFDDDQDGYYDDSVAACLAVWDGQLDCDDQNAAVLPGAPESCDAIDNDCDGATDEDFDDDGDTWFAGSGCELVYVAVDCDDVAPNVFPFNFEDCANGVDDNCDGAIDNNEDLDGDGYFTCTGDCNDLDASTYIGAAEVCDGWDQDCDFQVDNGFDDDGDGFMDGSDAGCVAAYPTDALDCDDGLATVNPDAVETCDAIDDDCDGGIDEDFDLDGDGAFDRFNGACVAAYGVLDTDCDDGDGDVFPDQTEACNGADDDCDGITDEGFDADSDGVWLDSVDCLATYGGPLDCDDNDDAVFPGFDGEPAADEICDGFDNDCDGVITEDIDADGFVDEGNPDCAGQDDLDCDDSDGAVNPSADELCEGGVDEDCDGQIDMDDPDCTEGDDDDDDATADDDDATGADDPEFVDDWTGERPTVVGGCTSCLGGGASLGGLPIALMLLRRRRR